MNRPDQFDQQLQQQHQHDQARHVLPADVRRTILQQAKAAKKKNWHGLWRQTQLAVSCALVLVLGYLLLPVTSQPQWYYQIAYSESPQYREVQHHAISNQPLQPSAAGSLAQSEAYQQYLRTEQQQQAFFAQTGLLRRQAEQWQITVCDELLLTIDKQLLSHLQLSVDMKPVQQQWVEFSSDASGQLIAIKPAANALACPHS